MKLKDARIKAALTVTRLAQEAGLSRATIEKMERGEIVSAVSAQAVANVISAYLKQEFDYQDLEIRAN